MLLFVGLTEFLVPIHSVHLNVCCTPSSVYMYIYTELPVFV
jgi:hypothetical protein